MSGALSDEKTNILSSGCLAPDLPTVLTEQANCFSRTDVKLCVHLGPGVMKRHGDREPILFSGLSLKPSFCFLLLKTSLVSPTSSELQR